MSDFDAFREQEMQHSGCYIPTKEQLDNTLDQFYNDVIPTLAKIADLFRGFV